jgi:hypothetical protein
MFAGARLASANGSTTDPLADRAHAAARRTANWKNRRRIDAAQTQRMSDDVRLTSSFN